MSAKFNNTSFNPLGQGTVLNTLKEWFIEPSEYSSAGKQRAENEKARQHATAERLASEAFNREEAAIAREWQERMANTSYQRMMADLKAAGINPLFAINAGGAATPSAASAQSHNYPSHAASTRDDMADFMKLIGLFTAGISAASKLKAAAPKTTLNVITGGTPTAAAKVGTGEYKQILSNWKRDIEGVNLKSAKKQINRYTLRQKGIIK
ncbi:MAG: hypothetical protein QXF82_05365, partial [Nitrososphaeria archaeon]